MNNANSLSNETISPEIYQRCLWALSAAGIVLIFLFLSWLSIQRAEILLARRRAYEAEQEIVTVRQERDEERQQIAKTVQDINERLAKAESGRAAAETEAHQLAARNATLATSLHKESAESSGPASQGKISEPNAQELSAFVRVHLAKMTGTVEAQLPDYAEEVEFHDKPRATLRMIENDRRMWAQRYPIRSIFVDEVQPQFSAIRDTDHGWLATAVFTWRWEFRTRSGAVVRGATRDTWKIVPSNTGLRILAEHSADPVTGQPKD